MLNLGEITLMTNDGDRSRYLLVLTYRRYLDAELGWIRARRAARAWFPPSSQPYRWTIGSPESALRKVHEKRQRALLQMEAARRKFQQAKAQSERRQPMIAFLPLSMPGHGPCFVDKETRAS